ncbi:hypothetical protein LTR86_004884 [Recurvomyces mirabilis]|nr:hypothetical protein LTR86_004884 [Recurvomyces mirabilis]
MDSLDIINIDFTNLRADLKALERGLQNKAKGSASKKGVKLLDHVDPKLAERAVADDLTRILQSPLTYPQAPSYGTMNSDAVQAIRRLHKSAKDLEATGDPEECGQATKALEERLQDFVTAVNPAHPSVVRKIAASYEGDESVHPAKGDGLGGAKGKPKEKAKAKAKEKEDQAPKGKQKPAISAGQTVALSTEGRRRNQTRAARNATRRRFEDFAKTAEVDDVLGPYSDGEE